MSAEAWLGGVALVLSIGTIINQILLARHSYISCELLVEYPRPDIASLRVQIGNASSRPKRLGPVFLLIGPVAENPITTFNQLVSPGATPISCCAIDFEHQSLRPLTDPGQPYRCLIPLTYFTEENDSIGDEVLTFTYPFPLPSVPRISAFSVRLYVYGHSEFRQRLHRKIQSVILTGPADLSSADTFGLMATEQPPCRAACKRLAGCKLSAGSR